MVRAYKAIQTGFGWDENRGEIGRINVILSFHLYFIFSYMSVQNLSVDLLWHCARVIGSDKGNIKSEKIPE